MKFIAFFRIILGRTQNHSSLFSCSLQQAIRDTFTEMGYSFDDKPLEEGNKQMD
jgi:hypothetical protein